MAEPASGPPPLDVTFSADGSYDPDGALGNIRWQFHDGSVYWGSTAYYTYQQAGTYQVTLTVWDSRNATDTDTLTVYVGQTNQAPVAVASANPTSGVAPLAVNFSSAGSYDPDGTISSYAWAFGDGGTSSQPNPSHTYTNAGTYQATLTVTDNQGATDSESVTITVSPPGCTSNCLRSTAINLTYTVQGNRVNVTGLVKVRTETGAVVPGATVYVTWTLPDGTSPAQSAATNTTGLARFKARSVHGTYTLTITNIAKTGYTFDPAHSVLSKSLIVP